MIVDSSALVAILAREPERRTFIEAIVDAEEAEIAAPTMLETSIALRRFEPELLTDLQRFVAESDIRVIAFGPEHLPTAQEAYRRFGRASGHAARLNFGDCISYAVATVKGEPLLFKGDDFVHTDVLPAIIP